MTTAVQHRRGTTAEHSTFTGLEGEVTIDTTKDTAVIHDGVLAGGYPLAKENLANVTTSGLSSIDGASTASDDKFFIYDQSATTLKTITRAELNNAIEQDALANVAITGGTINGTAIGGSTAAAGAFTTLSASGALTYGGVTLSNAVTGTGNMVLSNSPTLVTPALGTPSSGVVTNLTGTASININGTVGATTANTGAFTTLTTSGAVTHNAGTANGVAYLNGSKVLTTGSALTFDGTDIRMPNGGSILVGASVAGASLIAINGTAAAQRIVLGTSGTDGVINVTRTSGTTPNLIFQQESAELMRLTSTGLGIGTSSPAAKLQLGGYAGSVALRMSRASTDVLDFYQGAGVSYIDSSAAGGQLAFATVGSERMRLDSAGNLGLGVTPSFADGKGFQIYNASGASRLRVTNNTTGSGTADGAEFTVAGSDLYVINYEAANTIFWTNNSERARIDSSGNLLVGTTSVITVSGLSGTNAISTGTNSRWATTIRHTNTDPWGLAVGYSGASPNTTGNGFYWAADTTATRFLVYSNGGVLNYQANDGNLSDRREKTNFAPAGEYLSKICAIPVQTFNYIDQNMEEDSGLTLGVVAQDVQAVAPELVMESDWSAEKDGSKMRLSIYQTDLQYALMKCIQEQQAIINAQQAALNQLKARLDAANL